MSSNTGVLVVPIEPAPATAPSSIATPSVVNSCASNWSTGQTVCTGNNTDVYLISGSTLNATLTSGATGPASFSGGTCENCWRGYQCTYKHRRDRDRRQQRAFGKRIAIPESRHEYLLRPGFRHSCGIGRCPSGIPSVTGCCPRAQDGIYDLFDTSKTPPVEYGYSVGGGNRIPLGRTASPASHWQRMRIYQQSIHRRPYPG